METILDAYGAEILTPSWTFPSAYGALSSPLTVAGDKLLGVSGSTVFAVDIYTGKPASTTFPAQSDWMHTLQSEFGGDPRMTSCDGAVYLMDGDELLALRLADARRLAGWSVPKLKQVSTLVAQDGRVIAVSNDRATGATQVTGYTAATGEKIFGPVKVAARSPGPVVYGDKAIFFVAAGALKAVNVNFGDVRWTFADKDDVLDDSTVPLVAGKTVLAAGRHLHGVNLEDGKPLFQVPASAGAGNNVRWHAPAADVPTPVKAATMLANLRAIRPPEGSRDILRAAAPTVEAVVAGTAVATNTAGDVICISLIDGKVIWRRKVNSPGAPRIIDGVVYVTTDEGRQLARFHYATGLPAGAAYALPNLSGKQPVAIANGTLFLADDVGNIVARPFASQAAAYFDGIGAMVKIRPDKQQFDFGIGDFTVEAWFRSSTGGEIISGHPTAGGPEAHGFRLNLTPEGQLRVAVLNAKGTSRHVGRTNATGAADGQWHHVALMRSAGAFKIVLDGLSHEVRLPELAADTALSIGGVAALTIGAFVPGPEVAASNFFHGLIREVRIWDRALDMESIKTNFKVEMTGAEPRLRGLWRLDEVQSAKDPVDPHNAVSRHRVRSTFINPASRLTDLTMDRSAFPYLLHEPAAQWPYAGVWAARGELQMSGSPALSDDGVIAFATGNAIYAVNAHDGKRVWSMDIGRRASDPVADGDGFLILTREESLIYVGARSGAKVQLPAFAGMRLDDDDGALPAPATSNSHIAAATGGGTGAAPADVMIWDNDAPEAHTVKVDGAPLRLAFGDTGLLVMSETGSGFRLSLIDPASHRLVGGRVVTSEIFCSAGNHVFALDGKKLMKLNGARIDAAPLASSSFIAAGITGLTALADKDLLIVATDDGVVYGMTLGTLAVSWSTTLPLGTAGASKLVYPPVAGEGGRIVCTTAGGLVAILDGESGDIVGRYSMENGPIGNPLFAAGTVYTGCRDTIVNDLDFNLDGALHSVVFGETTVLRLNVDSAGKPIDNGAQHAVIEETTAGTLHLLEVHESCVEAWINAPVITGAQAGRRGGGIVGIAPTTESGFDINMWLDPDGTLHYASRALDEGVWSGLHVTAQTDVIDGKWHHIAASRSPAPATAEAGAPDRVILYIDGKPAITMTAAALAAPKTTVAGLKARIGATMDDNLAASRPFCGMIAEVRMWDTYLVANEISSRMNVKLRGDEPDLLAYWNFDYGAVHDSALQGHDGVLALESAAPAWWLTDLPFTRPAYPYISNTASIAEEAAEDKATAYALTMKVCAADSSGMAGKRVELWYILRSPEDPASIVINGTIVQGVKSGQEPDPVLRASNTAKVYAATTGADGTLKLSVISTRAGRGPSLDMWTDFMPVNERFHVNVLLDTQKLAKPAPPTLTAQAKLIQDYHYTTGNAIDHTRDRSTWRIVLRARETSDLPRAKEPITLWASEATSIEVLGKSYKLNADNAVTLDAEPNGEMTIVLGAEGLTAPTLYARAGFMHRNDRIVINADQDAHAQLSVMKKSDLTTKRSTNWKKKLTESDKETLLDPKYEAHASDVAQAVRQVTSVSQPGDPHAVLKAARLSPARRKLLAMRGVDIGDDGLLGADHSAWATPALAAMRQPATVTPSDRVVLRRMMAGMASDAPVNTDAFRASLGGALGFSFEVGSDPSKPIYTPLHTQAQVLSARGVATPVLHKPHLEGFFDDMWDAVKDAANTVYDAATKIVVTIADTVQLAITTMVNGVKNIVFKVVESVTDALNAVANFFEQLAVGIMKVIAFLRALFDWKAIIDTHTVLLDIFRTAFSTGRKSMKDKTRLINAIKSISGSPAPAPVGGASLNGSQQAAGGKDSTVIASSNSVQAKSILQKSTNSPAQAVESRAVTTAAGSADVLDMVMQGLPGLANSMLDLSPGDLMKELRTLLDKASSVSMTSMAEGVLGMASEVTEVADLVISALDTTINIPFVSALYKWVTGSELSVLSLLCLGLAVMVNVVYAVISLIMGEPRLFSDDAAGLGARMRAAAGYDAPAGVEAADSAEAVPAAAAEGVPSTPLVPEVLFMCFRAIGIVGDVLNDVRFTKMAARDTFVRTADDDLFLAFTSIIQGLSGILTSSLQMWCSQTALEARMVAVGGKDCLSKYKDLSYTVYALLMFSRFVKLAAATYLAYKLTKATKDEEEHGGEESRLVKTIKRIKAFKDRHEFRGTALASIIGVGLTIYLISQLASDKKKLAAYGNDDVTREFELFAIRDIISISTLSLEWMYVDGGVERMKRWTGPMAGTLYGIATVVRGGANVAALAVHGVAVFKYGDCTKGRLVQ